jgi:hypothetical protein
MALGPTQPLSEMSTRNLPGGKKDGRRIWLTTLPPSVSRLSKVNVGASTSHNPMGLHGLLQRKLCLFFLLPFTFTFKGLIENWWKKIRARAGRVAPIRRILLHMRT